MRMPDDLSPTLLAPCGVTCGVCYVYLRKKKPCLGCRAADDAKPGHCRTCKIKTCAADQGLDFCYQCASFPCQIIKRLDKSYRQRYQVSLIENGLRLKALGAAAYLQQERDRWTCAQCGGTVNMHDRVCSECGTVPAL
jgi:hypothetical protein